MSAASDLDRLAEVVAERHDLDQKAHELDDERDALIRSLIAAGARISGASDVSLTRVTGLSRDRIYQIRDGRR